MSEQFLGLKSQLHALLNLVDPGNEKLVEDAVGGLPISYHNYAPVFYSILTPSYGSIKVGFYGNLDPKGTNPARYMLVGSNRTAHVCDGLYVAVDLKTTPTRESLQQAFLAALAGVEGKILQEAFVEDNTYPGSSVGVLRSFIDKPSERNVMVATARLTGLQIEPGAFQVEGTWSPAHPHTAARILHFKNLIGRRVTFFIDPRDMFLLSAHSAI